MNTFGISIGEDWIKESGGRVAPKKVTLQTYIRNYIHHPENIKNVKYTDKQLKESTDKLIEIIAKI